MRIVNTHQNSKKKKWIFPLLFLIFSNSSCVATAFELLIEPCVSDLDYSLERDEASRHDEHVGVVVLLDELADLWCPAKSCADSLMLVEGHLDAVTCSAESDTKVNLA